MWSANNQNEARLAVHFQSIAERFSPHDTVFSFNTSVDLADSALSAACSLHTAPASIKSASSLRRKALAGITEDAAEIQTVVEATSDKEEEEEEEDQSVRSTGAENSLTRLDSQNDAPTPPSPTPTPSSTPSSSTIRKNSDKALPPIPRYPDSDRQPEASRERKEELVRPSHEGRRSSSSARPPTSEGYDHYDANGHKLKVKIGPRPSLDSADPASGGYNPRPVSSLPASVCMPLRKAAPVRNYPQDSECPTQPAMPTSAPTKVSSFSSMGPPFVRPIPSPPTPVPIRPRTVDSRSSAITPEKRRLMKAVELRQKQLAAKKGGQGPGLKGISTQPGEAIVAKPQPQGKDSRSPDYSGTGECFDILPDIVTEDATGVVRHGGAESGKEGSATINASPISIPEDFDGPSTQASSVSEEETPRGSIPEEPAGKPKESSTGADEGKPKVKRQLEGPPHSECNEDRQINGTEPPSPDWDDKGESRVIRVPEDIHSKDGSTDIFRANQPELELADGKPRETLSEEQTTQLSESVDASGYNGEMNNTVVSSNAKEDTSIAPHQLSDDIMETSTSPQISAPISRSLSPGAETVRPQEVPLPPISENEEAHLTPQQASFASESTSQNTHHADYRPHRATQVTTDPRDEDEHSVNTRASTGTRPSTADTVGDRRSMRPNRRHGLIEPIRRVSSGENSDDQFLSDDSFMEELKTATVQEAKPVRVSRSPIALDFPRPKSEHTVGLVTNPRSVSNPIDTTNGEDRKTPSPPLPTLQPPRAVSVSQLRSSSPPDISPPMLKKTGVSTGISQRIKALETLSSRPTSPSQMLHSPANPPTAFTSLGTRKSSLHSRPGTSDRPASRQSRSPTPAFEISSPKLTAPKPYNQFVSVSIASKPNKSRPESISVTAQIVRDERNRTPEVPLDFSQPQTIDLHHSPLKVEHRTSEQMPPPSKKPPIKRHTTAPSTSSTSTDHKGESFLGSPRHNSIHSGSNGSRRGSDVALSRSASEISLSGMSPDGRMEDKKESRKSRLLKRMSMISSASRRSIVTALSPAPAREQPIAEQPEPVQQAHSPPTRAVDMGDINIQFPDTLVSRFQALPIRRSS